MSTIQDDDGKNDNNENDNDIVFKTNKCFKVFFTKWQFFLLTFQDDDCKNENDENDDYTEDQLAEDTMTLGSLHLLFTLLPKLLNQKKLYLSQNY